MRSASSSRIASLGGSVATAMALALGTLAPLSATCQSTFDEAADPVDAPAADSSDERIAELESNGIDINAADIGELAEVPGISRSDAAILLERRGKAGSFASIEEAASTEGLSPTAVEALHDFGRCRIDSKTEYWIRISSAGAWHSNTLKRGANIMKMPDFTGGIAAGANGRWIVWAGVRTTPGASSIHAQKGQLVATGPGVAASAPAFGLHYDGGWYSVTAGTFKVGFGNGLTMDITGLKRPSGHKPCLSAVMSAASGSIYPMRHFTGAAASFRKAVGRDGWIVAGTVFASYRLTDPTLSDVTWNRCPDLTSECADGDKAPMAVWSDPAAAGESTSGVSLTRSLREATAGGAIGFGQERWKLEAIGWGTGLRFRPSAPGMWQSVSSPWPEDRRRFGAVGVAGHARLPLNGDLAAEFAVSDNGATAGMLETAFSPVSGLDLEPSIRYYGRNWDNPWTGSTADSREFRGNRARDEVAGRLDVTWRSSARTINRFRIDVGRNGHSDLAESRPQVALEAATALQVFASRHERLGIEISFRDRDLAVSGRGLSWDQYYSATTGNLSGGCRVDWSVWFQTKRIRRMALAIRVGQAFRDAATLRDRFDMDLSATLKIDANLSPGPLLSAFARFSDESMAADTSVTTGQSCLDREIENRVPGICRGDSRVETGLTIAQDARFSTGLLRIRAIGRYTRHVDQRPSWGSASGFPGRNEIAAAISFDLLFTGRTGQARPDKGVR